MPKHELAIQIARQVWHYPSTIKLTRDQRIYRAIIRAVRERLKYGSSSIKKSTRRKTITKLAGKRNTSVITRRAQD